MIFSQIMKFCKKKSVKKYILKTRKHSILVSNDVERIIHPIQGSNIENHIF